MAVVSNADAITRMPTYAVVGGSRGIGLEFVRQLIADPGNIVFVLVRNKANTPYLDPVVAAASANHIHVLQADVVDHDALKVAATEIGEVTGGGLDILIHNAARLEHTNMHRNLTDYDNEEQLNEEFLQSFKVNTLGVIHTVNAFLPLLRKGTAKKVVVLGTAGAERDWVWDLRLDGMAAYGTTKAATHMVVTKYAALLEKEGFTIVALSPGFVNTSETAVDDLNDALQKLDGSLRKMQGIPVQSPEESVKGMLGLIRSVGIESSGSFLRIPGQNV